MFSALYSHRRDASSVHRRRLTRRWWREQRDKYDLWTSQAVVDELSAGAFAGQGSALAAARAIRPLDVSEEAVRIAEIYIQQQLMPGPASGDALHLAIAALHHVDYLATWNVAHLANPNKVRHMTVLNRRLGLLSPIIVTPEVLWVDEERI